MRCPKCLKEFSPDELYCETCSAMLEPEESLNAGPQEKGQPAATALADFSPAMKSEEIQDIEVNYLRTDIEDRFVYALLFERDRLNGRLSETEQSLDQLRISNGDAQHPDTLSVIEKKEREMGDIIREIARVEATLDELQRTIESEISDLDAHLRESERPGVFGFFNASGRRSRMLFSQLKNKRILVDILSEKRSPNYFRVRRMGRTYLSIVLSMVLTLIISWQVFLYSHTEQRVPPPLPKTLQAHDKEKATVQEEDIIALLEDIKKANLNKDIGLWESRYSRQFRELPGKKESVVEQWKNFDCRSLAYNVAHVTLEPDKASALVTWKMELVSKKKNDIKILSQHLSVDFVVEDGILKIRSVAKQ
ncbi:MAG: hypothetical protein ABR903_01225 [Thermodesulfovibrionales bacterium]